MSPVAALTPEQLDSLGEEIATFATRINVAEHALLTRLRVFDAHEAWANQGARSCAEWLSWRTNLSIKAAREKVRVARALGPLPKIDALFGRGKLSSPRFGRSRGWQRPSPSRTGSMSLCMPRRLN
ncbi:MAG: DUF222 domain-containing protein [Enhygromyxa sp.]